VFLKIETTKNSVSTAATILKKPKKHFAAEKSDRSKQKLIGHFVFFSFF